MTHVITQACCNDAACVPVCPADCIHPAPGEDGFAAAEMLWIDPDECIDCGACTDVCPVDAIYSERDLPTGLLPFVEINGMFAQLRRNTLDHVARTRRAEDNPPLPASAASTDALRVAVVGTGPSAIFAADELLKTPGYDVRVSIFDRLPVAGGLIRFGVSPDHFHTKHALRRFPRIAQDERVSLFLNVEVGNHLQIAELLTFHHAVILAVGASEDRKLQIAGEGLPGSHSAREFVAWYNGHPDHAYREFDLSSERAVVIGNGNVALDVARILTADPDDLAKTDISDPALEALRRSKVREVVVVGRRGPTAAAFTFPELLGLTQLEGIAVRATGVDAKEPPEFPRNTADFPPALKAGLVADLAGPRQSTDSRRTIELRFLRYPHEIVGEHAVTGIRLGVNRHVHGGIESTGRFEDVACGLVLRSIGYQGSPMAGLPFDEHRNTLPHVAGRVTDPDTQVPLTGLYATGWAKRGPSGVIGTNRPDASETVTSLIADFAAARLNAPSGSYEDLSALVAERQSFVVDVNGWLEIERFEIRRGAESHRSRRKILSVEEMERVASFSRVGALS